MTYIPVTGKRPWAQLIAVNLFLAVGYFLTAKLSALLTSSVHQVAPVWVPSGFCLLFAMAFGWRIAPGILLGRLALMLQVYLQTRDSQYPYVPLAFALLTPTGSMLQAILAGWWLNRILEKAKKRHLITNIALGFLAILAAAIIPAGIHGTGLLIFSPDPFLAPLDRWVAWSYGDLLGMLLFLPLAVMFVNSPSRVSILKLSRFIAPAGFSLCLVFTSYWFVNKHEIQEIEQQFFKQANAITQQIDDDVHNLFQDIHLIIRPLQTTNKMNYAMYASIAESIFKEHPSLQALSWMSLVRSEDIEQVQQNLSRETGKAMKFTRRIGDEIFDLPPKIKQTYIFPIIYTYPFEPNRAVYGLDLSIFSHDILHKTITRGTPLLLPPIRLAQETGQQKGIVCYYPISPKSWDTLTQETPSLSYGLFNIVWRMDDFLRQQGATRDYAHLLVELRDSSDNQASEPLAILLNGQSLDSASEATLKKPPQGFTKRHEIQIFNQKWTLIVSAQDSFLRAHNTSASRIVLLAGVLISTLLGFLSHSNFSRSQAIETQVELQTRELRASESRAIQLAKAKSEFLAIMSHEIRTPMNGIIATSQLLHQSKLDQDQVELLEMLQSSSRILLNLINDILDYSKLESGKVVLHPHAFNPGDILQRLEQTMGIQARQKGLDFSINDQRTFAEALIGDTDRLLQALMNLCSNAIKFTEKGEVEVLCQALPIDDKHRNLEIAIRDTGIGFDPERLPELFQQFTQADSSTTRKYGGTGLGLAITRSIVLQMDGKLVADSKPGQGTTFTIQIPLEKADTHSTPTVPSSMYPPIPLSHHFSRALIAEDHDTSWQVIQLVLRQLKLECDRAKNGQEAVDMFSSGQYDIVILDCQMPVMSGIEAAREIRKLEKNSQHTPLIALTAFQAEANRIECEAAGMDAYLTKPMSVEDLQSILQRFTADS